MSTYETEVVTTHELRKGDVVHIYGMRVKLSDMRQTFHIVDAGGETYASKGKILNPEYLTTDEGRALFGGIMKLDGSDGWTVQGNRFATWAREVDETLACGCPADTVESMINRHRSQCSSCGAVNVYDDNDEPVI